MRHFQYLLIQPKTPLNFFSLALRNDNLDITMIENYKGIFLYSFSDVDECQNDPQLCSNGVCRNTPGSFECLCGDGYVLAKGTTACVGKP